MIINKTWRIISDTDNVILEKKHIKRMEGHEGEEYWTTEGYYRNVKNALRDLVDMEIRGTGMEYLKEINNKINELYTLIDNLSVTRTGENKGGK